MMFNQYFTENTTKTRRVLFKPITVLFLANNP